MESRNHRTLRHTLMLGMSDARNHTNAVYTPMLTLGPYTPHRTQKNPPAPPRDTLRDKMAGLKIAFDEAMKRGGI